MDPAQVAEAILEDYNDNEDDDEEESSEEEVEEYNNSEIETMITPRDKWTDVFNGISMDVS